MDGAVAETDASVRGLPRRRARECDDARLRTSSLIILNLVERRTQTRPR